MQKRAGGVSGDTMAVKKDPPPIRFRTLVRIAHLGRVWRSVGLGGWVGVITPSGLF